MVFAISCAATVYPLLGAGRAAVFPVLMVILMFGMFVASPRQMRWVTGYAVAAFGVAMVVAARRQPALVPPALEFGHFLLLATMAPAISLLAVRLAEMRLRARRQRQDLAAALVRIRELATRDELTGLVNRHHMRELMEQEHQRCIRSGRTFCLAVLDIDHFKRINEAHGRAVGDVVLRSVAHESMRRVRVSDAFARWGGDRFVLLLADARSPLAKRRRGARAQRHCRHARGHRVGQPAAHAVGGPGRAPRRRDRGPDAGPRRACAGRGQAAGARPAGRRVLRAPRAGLRPARPPWGFKVPGRAGSP